MDLTATINRLYAEKDRLDRAIAALEVLARPESDGKVAREKRPLRGRGRPPAQVKQDEAGV